MKPKNKRILASVFKWILILIVAFPSANWSVSETKSIREVSEDSQVYPCVVSAGSISVSYTHLTLPTTMPV